MGDNPISQPATAIAAEPGLAGLPLDELRRRAAEIGLNVEDDDTPDDLAAAIPAHLALLSQLDEAALHEILTWAKQPAPPGASREYLARRIAGVRKWNYHRLSPAGQRALAMLRGLDVQETDSTDRVLKALRSSESFSQRLRRKRRAWMASLLSRAFGLHGKHAPAAPTAPEPAPRQPKPNLKDQIVERGVVRGLATTLRGVTDDYIHQKLDEIEQRIDRKLNEIDQRLQEWRDREIANRLRIIKITLAASILVAALSFGYSWVKSHVARDRAAAPAAVPTGVSAAHGPGGDSAAPQGR